MITLDELLGRAGEVAASVLASDAVEVDRQARWPERGIRALQAAGLGGLAISRDLGGLGHRVHAVARVCEVLGARCASTGISFGMHLVGSAVVATAPTPEQRRRFVEPIAAGEHLTTLALSEPGTGVHFYLPETNIEHRDATFVVTGTKAFVTNGGHADSYVISGVAADSADPGDFSCLVVERDRPGLSYGAPWTGWGMRGNSAVSLRLEDVELPQDNLLGREGDQIWYVFRIITPFFLAAMAGTYLGIAAAALDQARAHLVERRHAHTGRLLGDDPVVQHRFGTLWARVEGVRALVHGATRAADANEVHALPGLCAAKAEVAHCAVEVAAEAMTLMGGRGYAAEGRIQRIYRDARAAHIMSPTTDLLRLWTARAVLDRPLLGS